VAKTDSQLKEIVLRKCGLESAVAAKDKKIEELTSKVSSLEQANQ